MRRKIFNGEDTPVLVQLLLIAGGMLAGTMAGSLLWTAVWGEETTVALKWLQALQSIFVFILPCVLHAMAVSQHPLHRLRLDKGFGVWQGIGAAVLFVAAIPLVNLLSQWNEQLQLPAWLGGMEAGMKAQEEAIGELTERFLKAGTLWELAGNIAVMAVLPAVSEELLFRGTLQPLACERMNRHVAVWCTAVLFSAIHMQWYGFVPRMLMGVALGYLLLWSGSVWLPMVGHFVNNACMVTAYYVAERYGVDLSWTETMGQGATWWAAAASAVVVGVLLYALRRSLTMNNASSRKASGN